MNHDSPHDDVVWRQALDWRRRLGAALADDAVRADHARWLAADPAHARAQARLDRVWRLSGRIPALTVVPVARRRPFNGLLSRLVLAAAACLAVVALPGLWPGMMADYRTATAETRRVALADGSTVHLDAATAMDVDFGDGRRGVALRRGQAFFEVAPDAARPFTVAAGAVHVTVVGTAFDVRRGDHAVSVSVRSGAVRVAAAGGEVLLTPGEMLAVDETDGAWTRGRVAPSLVASWRDGRLAVDGATIAEVVEELRRYHPGLIVLQDDDLARRRVSGVYDLSDPVAALRAVLHPHGGRVRSWPYVAVAGKA